MAANLEPIGVQAIAEGVGSFLNSMKQMEDAFDRTSKKLDGFAPATGQAVGDTQKLGGAISSILPSLSGMGGGLGAVVGALGPIAVVAGVAVGGLYLLKKGFDLLIDTIKAAASAIAGFVAEGMQLAGRFQEMEFSALAIGRAMGLQEDAIRGAIDTVRDAGIRYDVASKTVAQFARNQIDLAKATDLVRIAQGSAIMMGEDSSATMERMTWALTTANQRMLKHMGIFVNLEQANKRYAESLDRSTDSLTAAEKTQIAVNEAIKVGGPLLDVYAAAMESPTKKLRSLTGRELPELKAAIGAPFLQAWATAIQAVRDFVNTLTEAMQEGGALYPILVNLGAVASILADAFSKALGYVTDFISGLGADLGTGFGDIIVNMARWGAEMVAALAEGIVSATSTVLVTAMNAIGAALGFWLGPGSPAKVAPELVAWGVDAMAEFLHGMTEADFSILEAIQDPLKQVLSGLEYADISAEMIRALSEGGLDESMFARIEEAAGEFGTEIAELARLQYDLAEASQAVADAEAAVEEGRQKVTDLTAEYNQMLREGADPAALKAKLAEINAAEEGLDVAKEEQAAAEERMGALEEEAALQEDIVDQLIGLSQAAAESMAVVAAEVAEAATKIPAAIKVETGKISPEDILPEGLEWDISNRISDAIDAAKEAVAEKMVYIFQPLVDAWEEMKTGPLAEIAPAFANTWGLVQKTWDDFWGGFSVGWSDMDGVFQKFITEVKPALADAWRALGDLWAEVADLLGLADVNWGNLVERFGQFAGSTAAQFIKDFLNATVKGIQDFAEAVDWVADRVAIWNRALEDLKIALEYMPLGDILSLSTIMGAIEVPEWLRPGSTTPFEEGLRGISSAMTELAPAIEGFFGFQQMRLDLESLMLTTIPLFVNNTVLEFLRLKEEVIQYVNELVQRMIQRFTEMKNNVIAIFQSMFETVLSAMDTFLEAATKILDEIAVIYEDWASRVDDAVAEIVTQMDRLISKLDKLIDKAKEAEKAMEDAGLLSGSPSKLELGLRGAASAMRRLSAVELPRLSAAMYPMPAYAPAPAAAGATTTTHNVTVPITANIYNDMDAEAFQIRVERAVVRAGRRFG